MKLLRNNASMPPVLNGLSLWTDNFAVTGGGTIVYETRQPLVLLAVAFSTDASATPIMGAIADSTTYTGTKKVTFTAVTGKSYQMFMISTEGGYTTTAGTVSSGTTVDDPEVY